MPITMLQAALVGGEMSPSTQGRADLDRFRASLDRCENFVVRPTGGVVFRSGTEFTGQTPGGQKVLLIPFTVSAELQYLLELSEKAMRVIYRGGYIASPPLPTHATALTIQKTEDVYITATAADYSFTKDDIGSILTIWNPNTSSYGTFQVHGLYLTGIAVVGNVLPAQPFTTISTTQWTISEFGKTPGEALTIATPWGFSELAQLDVAQSVDVMTVCHPDHRIRHIKRYSDYDWRVEEVLVVGGPFGPWNTSAAKQLKLLKDPNTGAVTATFATPSLDPTLVGCQIDIEPETLAAHWQAQHTYPPDTTVRSEGKYYRSITGGTSGTLRPSHASGEASDGVVRWLFVSGSSTTFRIESITGVSGGLGSVASLTPLNEEAPNIYAATDVDVKTRAFTWSASDITSSAPGTFTISEPDHLLPVGKWLSADIVTFSAIGVERAELKGTSVFVESTSLIRCLWHTGKEVTTGGKVTIRNPLVTSVSGVTSRWRLGAWNDVDGWPTKVCYYQQRQVFFGNYANPMTIWLSGVNRYTDFSVSFPRSDDDAFTLPLGALQQSSPSGLLPMKNLMVFTTSEEWVVGTAESGAPVTLETARAAHQSSWGAEQWLQPRLVGDAAMFVVSKAKTLRDMDYDYARDRFIGNDLSVAVGHLFKDRRVVSWAYQQTPHSVVWCVLDDGSVVALTYLREQEVVGWHRHSTDGTVEQVVCVSEGVEDRVYMVVRRNTQVQPTAFEATATCEAQQYGGTRIPAPVVVTAESAVFQPSDVGRVITIPLPEGSISKAVVRYVSSTQVECEKHHIGFSYDNLTCTITQVARYVERMATPDDDLYLDSAVVYSATVATELSGLGHLEGQSVYVQAQLTSNGVHTVLGPLTVTGGSVTVKAVPDPDSYIYKVGLAYTGKLRTLDVDLPTQESTRVNTKILTAVLYLLGEYRFTPKAGVDELSLYDAVVEARAQDEPSVARVDLPSTWERKGRTTFVNDKPGPCEVLSILPVVTLGGV